jgi:hypothetical protein
MQKKLADAVSRKSGIDSQSSRTKCKSWSDCNDGACAIRREHSEGYCIPTWFGVCHAWAPVSMVEDEPMKAVTINDVTFEPMDIKALITQIYDTAKIGTIFTGQRCNLQNPQTDQNGRFVNQECRDVTPEFFHLVLTNLIGRFDRSFIADVSADYQVWNHPAKGYEINLQEKISREDAMKRFFPAANSTSYIFNQNAKDLLHVQTINSYITESNENTSGLAYRYTTTRYFDYLLELDAQDNIIGGEWVDYSKLNHPDFIYIPVGAPKSDTIILGGIKYSEVKNMIKLAQ